MARSFAKAVQSDDQILAAGCKRNKLQSTACRCYSVSRSSYTKRSSPIFSPFWSSSSFDVPSSTLSNPQIWTHEPWILSGKKPQEDPSHRRASVSLPHPGGPPSLLYVRTYNSCVTVHPHAFEALQTKIERLEKKLKTTDEPAHAEAEVFK